MTTPRNTKAKTSAATPADLDKTNEDAGKEKVDSAPLEAPADSKATAPTDTSKTAAAERSPEPRTSEKPVTPETPEEAAKPGAPAVTGTPVPEVTDTPGNDTVGPAPVERGEQPVVENIANSATDSSTPAPNQTAKDVADPVVPAPSAAPLDAPAEREQEEATSPGIRDSEVGVASSYEHAGVINAATGEPITAAELEDLFLDYGVNEKTVNYRLLEYRVFAGNRPSAVLLVAAGATISVAAAEALKARIDAQLAE